MTQAAAGGSELVRRVATAAVALPLLLGGMLWAPPLVGFAIVTIAIALGAWEYDALLVAKGLRPLRVAGALVLAAAYANVSLPWPLGVPLWPLAALVVLTALVLRASDFARDVPAAALTLLGAVYLGGLGGSIAALRLMHPISDGSWRIVLLLAIVMAADTAAYFTGRALGRHKLAPAISPGKTIEGAVGGLAGGILGALAVRGAGLALPVGHAVVLGALVAVAAMAGDLVESLLKRWAGVKDSGALFPGHGGMLDRLDSLLFGGAVLYYYFSLFG
ncbi:MAG: phosphatidate cytidylyltransferase [Vicinamibacteria bacterium]